MFEYPLHLPQVLDYVKVGIKSTLESIHCRFINYCIELICMEVSVDAVHYLEVDGIAGLEVVHGLAVDACE